MIALSFRQTQQEFMVRVAATILFKALQQAGCAEVQLSALTEKPQYGFTASASSEPVGPKLVRITDLQDGRIDWEHVPYCGCNEPDDYRLESNDLLFARTGATTGKTLLVTDTEEAVFASYLIRVRPKGGILPAYLYAFFQSDIYWAQIIDEKEGSAQPNCNGAKLAAILIPSVDKTLQSAIGGFLRVVRARQQKESAPLPELPSPLTHVKQIVESLEDIVTKTYEAKGLRCRAAEEVGNLVAAEIRRIFVSGREQGWAVGRLADYVTETCYGTSAKTSADNTGTPILRMGNIQNGRLDTNSLAYLHLGEQDRCRLLLKHGDILVNRTNSAELVGKCAVFDLEREFAFASYLIRVGLDRARAEPALIAAYVNSPIGREYMFRERKQMTGQANVNAKKIAALPIALPPLPEQRRIVAYLDDLQAKVDALKAQQAQSAAELDALLPSILDKAFKGEL